MGPKAKPKTPKGKQPADPGKNADESVTQVEKEFFEFTLADIEKKLKRIDIREEELTTGSAEIEEKIEEHKKEKGEVITEHEQLLASKEEIKQQKRNEMNQLSDEIKIRIEKYKICMQEWKNKREIMVKKYKAQIEEQEEEIQDLEHHKQNKEVFFKELDEMEEKMEKAEVQQKRKLFGINKEREETIMKIKKDVQSRIIHFSAELRKINQKKIGNPCHRTTAENKAIQNLLLQMQEEILEYQEKCRNSKTIMIKCKNITNAEKLEKDKTIARTLIQLDVIKELLSQNLKLWKKLKTYDPVFIENQNLTKKFNYLSLTIENRLKDIEETKKSIADKIENTKATKTATSLFKKKTKSLQRMIRNALKIAEEAIVVRLIPIGKMEGEKYLPTDAKIRLFKKRRDSVFKRKGKILQYLLDNLSQAQLTEDDKKLLKGSSESLTVEKINFSSIFGKPISPEELERLEAEKKALKESKRLGPMTFTSLTSLPRSESVIVIPEKVKSESEYESFEGELEEYEEYEEDEITRVGMGETELFDEFGSKESEQSETEI